MLKKAACRKGCEAFLGKDGSDRTSQQPNPLLDNLEELSSPPLPVTPKVPPRGEAWPSGPPCPEQTPPGFLVPPPHPLIGPSLRAHPADETVWVPERTEC